MQRHFASTAGPHVNVSQTSPNPGTQGGEEVLRPDQTKSSDAGNAGGFSGGENMVNPNVAKVFDSSNWNKNVGGSSGAGGSGAGGSKAGGSDVGGSVPDQNIPFTEQVIQQMIIPEETPIGTSTLRPLKGVIITDQGPLKRTSSLPLDKGKGKEIFVPKEKVKVPSVVVRNLKEPGADDAEKKFIFSEMDDEGMKAYNLQKKKEDTELFYRSRRLAELKAANIDVQTHFELMPKSSFSVANTVDFQLQLPLSPNASSYKWYTSKVGLSKNNKDYMQRLQTF